MLVETVTTKGALILTNLKDVIKSDNSFSFTSKIVEFGTDNCAVNHIYSNLELFFSIKSIDNIGVTGSILALGIGIIKFTIIDNTNKVYVIELENVIYLPESAKNLISTSQWSRERGDNCGTLPRGK